jgi:hypothetical protein
MEQIDAPLVGQRLAPLEERRRLEQLRVEQEADIAAQISALGPDEARLARADLLEEKRDILRAQEDPELPRGHALS